MSKLQFGLGIPPTLDKVADPVGLARRAEELGFDFVSTSDHPCGTEASWEAWTVLSWIAASTSTIRVASRVLGVPYRPPTVVAKMAETFSRLSDGRLILGLGGGHSDEEFEAFGLRVPTPREKVDGLAEAIEITRGLWSTPNFSYEGKLFRTSDASIAPLPEHPIPIWLGTFGPRALAVTGALADGWIPSLGFAPPGVIEPMRDRVLAAAEKAGRSQGSITFAYHIGIRVDSTIDPDPGVVVGPADYVVGKLAGFVELGFTTLSFATIGPGLEEQAELLATEVIPALARAA